MPIPSLKEFIDAMSSSWPVALAISIGSASVLLSEEWLHLSYIQGMPGWFYTTAFLVFIFSSSILVVSILQTAIHALKLAHKTYKDRQNKQKHIKQLSEIPNEELHVLVWAARSKRKSFVEELHHPQIEPLIAKGFIKALSGHHSVLDWPYIIPDHIWDALGPFSEAAPEEYSRYPFRSRF